MKRAPPTVPGMPSACSRPARPRVAAARARRPRFAAAPARTCAPPSPSCQSTRANPRPSFTTTPRTPPSPTSTLEPPPRSVTRAAERATARTTKASSSTVSGTTRSSAGPPMRNDVCRASGSPGHARTPRRPEIVSTSGAGSSITSIALLDQAERQPRLEEGEQLVGRAVDVARPEGQHQIPATDGPEQGLRHLLARRHPAHVEMPAPLERMKELLARGALEPLLTGRVDVGQHEDVDLVERLQEFVEQVAGAGVAVRLEGRHQPAREALPRGAQRGADLLGMVRVVVHHEHVLLLPLHLEAAMDAAELLEGVRRDAERDLEVGGDGEGGERVEGVMAAGHAEPDGAEPPLAAPDLEHGLEPVDAEVARLPVGVGRRPVGDEALADVRHQGAHRHAVEAEDGQAVERDAVDELEIRLAHPVHVPVVVEVLAVDVGDDGDDRREEEEGAVALVGLGDQELPLAETGVAPECAAPPAHDDRRVAPGS